MRRHRNINVVTTERRRNYSANFFTDNLLATEMTKTQILMSKPAY